MNIESALIDHLSSDSNVTDLIKSGEASGEKYAYIFPLQIPADKDAPAIVYQRVSSPRTLSLDGKSSVNNPRIQLSCYAYEFASAKKIAMALYDSLDCFVGKLAGKAKAVVLLADSRDGFEHETGRYRCDVDFFVMHTKKKG